MASNPTTQTSSGGPGGGLGDHPHRQHSILLSSSSDSDSQSEGGTLSHTDYFPNMPAPTRFAPDFPGPDHAPLPNARPPAEHSLFQASSGFLSSSSSEGDESMLFTTTITPRAKRPPKSIAGTKSSFILGDKLGEGAHAIVKEGMDQLSLRIVAVKILDMRRLRRVRGGLDAVDREIAVQKRLKRHPNLIELIDVVRQKAKNKMYIILEMANGCPVQSLLDAAPQKRLVESQVVNFAYQTLVGLQYMHGKGVVHRDVKPSNLMLTANGILKISDFGVAEFLDEYDSEDNVSRTSGSPAFQAPEIARGEHGYSGMKVDVWALGVSLYLMLSGRIPFEGESLIDLFQNIGEGKYDILEGVSDECQHVIACMLTVDWKERISVDDLLKNAWISRGAIDLSPQQREEKGWMHIPKKEFGILDVVKRMYVTDDDASRMSGTSTVADEKRLPERVLPERFDSAVRRPDDGTHCTMM